MEKTVDVEKIKNRRNELENDKQKCLAQLNAIVGAMAICDEFLVEPQAKPVDNAEQDTKAG